MKEKVYEWEGHTLYFDGTHYIMDSKEDIDAVMEHLRDIMSHNPTYTDAYKNAKYLYCDFFLRGIGIEVDVVDSKCVNPNTLHFPPTQRVNKME